MHCLTAICPLLLDHGTADQDAGIGVGTNILELVSASADYEVAAMFLKSHGASTVRIHGIGPREKGIQAPIRIEYSAATEVEDSTRREAARAVERVQAHLVFCSIVVYRQRVGRRSVLWPIVYWMKARKGVGITAVQATQIIGFGAGQGDL